jgi:hypothetical protein
MAARSTGRVVVAAVLKGGREAAKGEDKQGNAACIESEGKRAAAVVAVVMTAWRNGPQ